jgi:hypothetical protein
MKAGIVLTSIILGGFILSDNITNDVYICSDKHKNPPDVQAQCKKLTRGQWWHK